MLQADINNNKLYYNYLIIDDHNLFFNFDKLDTQYVKYGSNIPQTKVLPIIRLAKKIIFLWNEKSSNDMIVKAHPKCQKI